MNNDQQFWTAFKQAALTAPEQQPKPGQWEALESQLNPKKRNYPWLIWLAVNLIGVSCLYGFSNLLLSGRLSQAAEPAIETVAHTISTADTNLQSSELPVPEFTSDQPSLSSVKQTTPTATPPAQEQADNRERPLTPSPTTDYNTTVYNTTNYNTPNQHRPSAQATPQLPTRPLHSLPVTDSPLQLPEKSLRKIKSRHLSVQALLQPLANYDGQQGLQFSIGLTARIPFGLRASFRLSQVQTAWEWSDFSPATISDFRDQAPGLLLDARRTEKAILASFTISKPLLNEHSLWQLSPGFGSSLGLYRNSNNLLTSVTEYNLPQDPTRTSYNEQAGFQYWASHLQLEVQRQISSRLSLMATGRRYLNSRNLPPGGATALQFGLSYRFR